ncbi:MAG: alpha/beta hydrolase [Anaerolineae bacterium]|nr:alpha/beta hydrolase [Anaerolineae bacterium]
MSAISLGSDLIHYEVLGRGRPVILLHSWVGSWRYWIPTMQQLQVKYKVYALDLYGYGDSVKNPKKYTIAHQVQLLADFVDKLGIAKTALVGHGLGALVAAEYARQYSDKVPRMMVVSLPLFDPGDLDHRREVIPEVVSTIRQQAAQAMEAQPPDVTVMSASAAMRAALAEASRRSGNNTNTTNIKSYRSGHNPLGKYIADSTPRDLLEKCFRRTEPEYEKLLVDVAKTDTQVLKLSTSAYDSGDVLEKLRMLPIPVVIVHGVDDLVVPIPDDSVWNYITTDKENSMLPVPLPGVRHFPMLESERFTRLVHDFLDTPDVSKLEIKERWKRRTR